MEIRISNDGLQAFLVFTEHDREKPPDPDMIQASLEEAGVAHGVNIAGWEAAFEAFRESEDAEAEYVVANGTPPTAGENGRLEYLFETEVSLQPHELPDGSVDFRGLNIVKNVQVDQPVARLHPPTIGKPGMTVTGDEIPGISGKAAEFPAGQNVAVSPNDPNILLATLNGNIRLSRSKQIIVEDLFVVRGNVDFETGNVRSKGSVLVKGDVKSGFTVQAEGDITIRGSVEDATVVSASNVYVKKGFVGRGSGQIKADGSVHIGHIANQNVTAGENVVIAGEAIQSKISAGGAIEIKCTKGSIIGGAVSAGTSVRSKNIGSPHAIRTDVTIGYNKPLEDACKNAQKQRQSCEQNLARVKEGIATLVRLKLDRGTLPPEKGKLLANLKTVKASLEAQLENLKASIEEIEKELEQHKESAKIVVQGELFPGTYIHCHSWNLPVRRVAKRLEITPKNLSEIQKMVT